MDDRHVVAGGLVLCVAGGLLVVVPSLGSAALPALVATVVALLVVAVGLLVALNYAANPDSQSVTLPDPERVPHYRRPGATLRAQLSAIGLTGRRQMTTDAAPWDGTDPPRERLRATLRDLAVAVIARTTGCAPAEAARRLDDGDWTDDDEAAEFFAAATPPPVTWRQRLGLPGGDPLPVIRRARRAVAALSELAVGERPALGDEPAVPDPEGTYWPTGALPVTRATGRTRQVAIGVLLASGVGVFAASPGMILVATLGVALAGAAKVSSPTVSLTLSRHVEGVVEEPGDEVRITVTVRNDGDRTLPDLRLLDGVPAGVSVVEDTPRTSTALRPEKTDTFSYTVEVPAGTHRFEPAIAVASDFVGATERIEAVPATDGSTTLSCGFDVTSDSLAPPRDRTTVHSGRVDADARGAGVEFETVREYRPGDPPSRIDWRRRARTGDLSTVDFREPRRPRVVILVDTRPPAYVAAGSDSVPAPRHAARAAAHLADAYLAGVCPVGLATVGTDCWIPPKGGTEQCQRLRRTLAATDAVPWVQPTETPTPAEAAAGLTARLSAGTQVVVVSPLADDGAVDLCRHLAAAGHAVTVVSPDCTDAGTVTGAYGACQRWRRCSTLRGADVRVHDWSPADPVPEVMARATQF